VLAGNGDTQSEGSTDDSDPAHVGER